MLAHVSYKFYLSVIQQRPFFFLFWTKFMKYDRWSTVTLDSVLQFITLGLWLPLDYSFCYIDFPPYVRYLCSILIIYFGCFCWFLFFPSIHCSNVLSFSPILSIHYYHGVSDTLLTSLNLVIFDSALWVHCFVAQVIQDLSIFFASDQARNMIV